jgi:hypothetical protein
VISGRNCRDATLTLLGSLGLQQKKRITPMSGCQYGFETVYEDTRGGNLLIATRIYDSVFLQELQRGPLGNRTQLSLRQ